VRQAGRNAPVRDMWTHHDPEIRQAVRAVIEGPQWERPPGNDKR
jgi:hypothetical protein